MKVKPIIFSAPMVRAIRDDRKTQTRQIMSPQPSDEWTPHHWGEVHKLANGEPDPDKVIGWGPSSDDGLEAYPCPYQPGDVLWVREAWRPEFDGEDWFIQYRAGGTFQPDDPNLQNEIAAMSNPTEECHGPRAMDGESLAWRPSIHMPKWACREFLKVESVRAQRVQDIAEADAIAEGVSCGCHGGFAGVGWDNEPIECSRCSGCIGFVDLFAPTWDEIHGPGAWARNDWVWAYTFTRTTKPEGFGQ